MNRRGIKDERHRRSRRWSFSPMIRYCPLLIGRRVGSEAPRNGKERELSPSLVQHAVIMAAGHLRIHTLLLSVRTIRARCAEVFERQDGGRHDSKQFQGQFSAIPVSFSLICPRPQTGVICASILRRQWNYVPLRLIFIIKDDVSQ